MVAPLAAGCAALLAYNYLRFGRLLEFGQGYQLWGIDERAVRHFSLSYVPFNLWLYFLSLPEVSPYFPFFRTVWPDQLPAGYITTEEIHGLLFAMPTLLLGVLALFHAWRRGSGPVWHTLRWLLVAATGASVLSGGVLCCFAGGCSRYVTELMAGWSVVSAIGFLILFTDGERVPRTTLLRWFARIATVWTVLYVWLASFEFRGFARLTQPAVYRAVATVFNYPSFWAAQRSGQVYGPVTLKVQLSAEQTTGTTALLAAGSATMLNQLVIIRPALDQVQLRLMVNEIRIVETPVLHVGPDGLQVECYAPWLYPPAAHPYWTTPTAPVNRELPQHLFGLRVGDGWYARLSDWVFDATSFDPIVRTQATRPQSCAWVQEISRLIPPATAKQAPAPPAPPVKP